jgi:hypothetical protein
MGEDIGEIIERQIPPDAFREFPRQSVSVEAKLKPNPILETLSVLI